MTRLNSVISGILSCIILAPGAPAQSAAGVHISVNDPRPLAAAALQLQKQTGMAINYEDIPYTYAGDIVNNTAATMATKTPAQQSANPNLQYIVPRGGQLSLDSEQAVSGTSDVLQLLTQLTNASTANGYPGAYAAAYTAGVFSITPTQMKDSSGNWSPVTPVLDTAVTFPSAQRSVDATLQLILGGVSQNSGTKVVLGMGPLPLLIGRQITIGANNESARSVISRLFLSLIPAKSASGALTVSYRLLFDPKVKYYVLNLQSLAQAPAVSTSVPRPKPTSPGPYAKKP